MLGSRTIFARAFEFPFCVCCLIICHVGHLCIPSRGFYLVTQIFWAQSEAAIELGRSKAVDWHYFRAACTEIRVRDDFLGPLSKIIVFFGPIRIEICS
jgi:hypothetical protein